MKKFIKFAALLTGAAVLFTSCGAAKASEKKDEEISSGKTAVLFSSLAQVWVLAGGTVDITVGESVERGFASEEAVLVDEGAGHSVINTELLIASEPRLVIGTADYPCQQEAAELCQSCGIDARVYSIESISDYLSVLREFCSLTGNEENYRLYGENVKQESDKVIQDCRSRLEGKEVSYLFIRAGSSARSTKVKTAADVFACAMADELGAVNIAGTGELLSELSLEEILVADPDIILVSSMGNEEASRAYVSEMLKDPGWSQLSAVKNGRVVFLDKELFHFKPNNRWAEAYSVLGEIILEAAED